MSENLPNKPLVEAIFELTWKLQESPQGSMDPNYQILVGRFYDRIQKEYPKHEQLLPSFLPEEMAANTVQHRFSKEDTTDSIIQLGSGILTVNSTEKYKWETFKPEIIEVIRIFIDSYPRISELEIASVSLRYIDAIDINLEEISIYDFLSKKLKINIELEPKLFDNGEIENDPLALKLNFVFKCNKPKGLIIFDIGKGQRNQKDVIILNYVINSKNNRISSFFKSPEEWLTEAHFIADRLFLTLVEGELLESFR